MDYNSEVAGAVWEARLSTYRALAPDDEGAWRLYRWNIELAASVAPLISDAEVALRKMLEWMCPDLADGHRSEHRLLNALQLRPAV